MLRIGVEHQRETPTTHALAFEERLALIADRERLHRQNSRYRGLLRDARLKVAEACIEDISYKPGRGLDKSQLPALALKTPQASRQGSSVDS